MRRLNALALLLALVFAAVQSGCNATPAQATLNARETYTATLKVLTPLVESGVIDLETAEEIEKVRVDAAEALDAMEEAAIENDRMGWQFASDAFHKSLDRLIAHRIEAERAQRDDG